MMTFDSKTERVMQMTLASAQQLKSQLVVPEHVLHILSQMTWFEKLVEVCGGNAEELKENLNDFLENIVPRRKDGEAESSIADIISDGFASMIETAASAAEREESDFIYLHHIVYGMYKQKDSFGMHYLGSQVGNLEEFINMMRMLEDGELSEEDEDSDDDLLPDCLMLLNDVAADFKPLIGREDELDRIMRILLRREKNNPLLVGEPGVGKTSIVKGLVKRIVEGNVPEDLKGARVYSLDVGMLLAGTQYRGDFEKRLIDLMEYLAELDDPVVFIDEIHNLVGAGNLGSNSMDASNMMRPYLEEGSIRFIGATTYDEHKRHFTKNQGFARRFCTVDIKEPDEEEAIKILQGIKGEYEKFHGIKFGKESLETAVKLSKSFMGGRYLPDKAIDLIDEAAAWRRMHPEEGKKRQTVGRDVIETVLAELSNIPKATAEQAEVMRLKDLYKRITSSIFGQEEAVRRIVDSIYMSRAGLLAENKPIASLLFVGPTGVGKTEVAKVLARELGINFVRFDMSEYAEKHTVSKLIGSPAGYVGYEDGGLLTDAVRRNPHCVLLLDEIEKAHPDIFNVLLQVMDYASLTDNKGQKADFKNVIIIMTSNAGARLIGRQSIGFGARSFNDGVMMEEVKRVFTPEFRNRLSAVVTFNHMNDRMAEQITEKKLKELSDLLLGRKVNVSISREAMDYICRRGTTRDYGGREIERAIDSEIKPLFVNEILFGRLRKGGSAELGMEGGKPKLRLKGRVSVTAEKGRGKKREGV